jgi:hypothetical protein
MIIVLYFTPHREAPKYITPHRDRRAAMWQAPARRHIILERHCNCRRLVAADPAL